MYYLLDRTITRDGTPNDAQLLQEPEGYLGDYGHTGIRENWFAIQYISTLTFHYHSYISHLMRAYS